MCCQEILKIITKPVVYPLTRLYQIDEISWTNLQGMDFPGGSVVKNPSANTGDTEDVGLIPGQGRSPGGGKWLPSPVFLPRKSHGQRSLAVYSPWGHEESDTTEQLSTHIHTTCREQSRCFYHFTDNLGSQQQSLPRRSFQILGKELLSRQDTQLDFFQYKHQL